MTETIPDVLYKIWGPARGELASGKVGPGRMVAGIVFMGLALYLAPSLFGRPPQGLIWDRLVIGILPPDAGTDFARETGSLSVASEGGKDRETKATETDPEPTKHLHHVQTTAAS